MRRNIIYTFIIIVFLFTFTNQVNANSESFEITKKLEEYDKIVSHSFNNTLDGWNKTLFNNIQDAINAANNSEKILVMNGTYLENIVVNKNIKLKGEDKNNTIIDGNGKDIAVDIVSNNTNISNLLIKNNQTGATGINIQAINVTIHKNIITLNGWAGIQNSKNFDKCKIIDNKITKNGYGIFLDKKTTILDIKNNNIKNNSWDGIYLSKSENSEISKNIIENNKDDGIGLNICKNILIINNDILKNKDNGIYMFANNVLIENNIISSNINSGIFFKNSKNNDVNNNYINYNNEGLTLSSKSTDNNIIGNNFVENSIGIYIYKNSKTNNYKDNGNIFLENNKDIVFEEKENKSPGFSAIIILLSIFILLFLTKGFKKWSK